jgi:amino acid permease
MTLSARLDSKITRCYNPSMPSNTPPLEPISRETAGMTPAQLAEQRERDRQMRTLILAIAGGAIVLLVLLGLAVYALLQPGTPTDRIRDVFIIVVSFETLVIGIALIVLLVQLASLINLLRNEVRPILHATSETVNTLRGTADFLGESVVEPVIKLNTYLASIQRVLELMGIRRK